MERDKMSSLKSIIDKKNGKNTPESKRLAEFRKAKDIYDRKKKNDDEIYGEFGELGEDVISEIDNIIVERKVRFLARFGIFAIFMAMFCSLITNNLFIPILILFVGFAAFLPLINHHINYFIFGE